MLQNTPLIIVILLPAIMAPSEGEPKVRSYAPEVVPPDDKENAPVEPDTRSHYYRSNADTGSKPIPKQQRICGLAPKLFWATMLALVIILAAGIGGGVSGGLAARNKR